MDITAEGPTSHVALNTGNYRLVVIICIYANYLRSLHILGIFSAHYLKNKKGTLGNINRPSKLINVTNIIHFKHKNRRLNEGGYAETINRGRTIVFIGLYTITKNKFI